MHGVFGNVGNATARRAVVWSLDSRPGDRNMGTKVSSDLKHKGHDVVTVAPLQTVAWIVKVLSQKRIGAVPVINEDVQLIGIISDRDINRDKSEHGLTEL